MSLHTMLSITLGLFILMPAQLSADEAGWCNFNGEVIAVNESSIVLDYGDGNIKVIIHNWKWLGEERNELRGDSLRVSGLIEAGADGPVLVPTSIYLPDHHVCHHVKGIEQATAGHYAIAATGGNVVVEGTVTAEKVRQFTLQTGERELTVETRDMLYNPLDDVGHQQINVGDRVLVFALADRAFFERAKLSAKTVISLVPDLESQPSATAKP